MKIFVATLTITLALVLGGCGQTDQPQSATSSPTAANAAVHNARAEVLKKNWDNIINHQRPVADIAWKNELTGTNEQACNAWNNWRDIMKFRTDVGEQQVLFGDIVPEKDFQAELERQATLLVTTTVRGKGEFDCGDRTGGLQLIDDAVKSLETAHISPAKAGVTSADFRAVVIREIKPTADSFKKNLANKGKELSGDETGYLSSVIEKYHLTAAELGFTEDQFKLITDH